MLRRNWLGTKLCNLCLDIFSDLLIFLIKQPGGGPGVDNGETGVRLVLVPLEPDVYYSCKIDRNWNIFNNLFYTATVQIDKMGETNSCVHVTCIIVFAIGPKSGTTSSTYDSNGKQPKGTIQLCCKLERFPEKD